MISKSIDYWVTGFNLPTESDIADAIEAARMEKAIIMLHWHTPAYPYYGSSSDMMIEITADDNVADIMDQLPTVYGV